jgi:hypothetical protein
MVIVYNPDLTKTGERGYTLDGVINIGSERGIADTLMHEVTHGTQDLIAKAAKLRRAGLGGNEALFDTMSKEVETELQEYLEQKYPLAMELLNQLGETTIAKKTYHLLEGELQACTRVNSIIFEQGFRLNPNKTILYSPDGKAFPLTDKLISANIGSKRSSAKNYDLDKYISYFNKLNAMTALDAERAIERKAKAAEKFDTPAARMNASQSASGAKKMGEALSRGATKTRMTDAEYAAYVAEAKKQSLTKHKAVLDASSKPLTYDKNTGQGYSVKADANKFADRLETDEILNADTEISNHKRQPSPLDKRYKRRYSYGTITAELAALDTVKAEDTARKRRGNPRIITKAEYDASTPYENIDWNALKAQHEQYLKEVKAYEDAVKQREKARKEAEDKLATLTGKEKLEFATKMKQDSIDAAPIKREDYVKTHNPQFWTPEQFIAHNKNKHKNLINMLNRPVETITTTTNGEGYSKIVRTVREQTKAEKELNEAYVTIMNGGYIGTRDLKSITASLAISKAISQAAKDRKTEVTKPVTKSRTEMQTELFNKIVELRVEEAKDVYEDPMAPHEIKELRKIVRTKLAQMSDKEIKDYYNKIFNRQLGSSKRDIGPTEYVPITKDTPGLPGKFYIPGKQRDMNTKLFNFLNDIDIKKVDSYIAGLINDRTINMTAIHDFAGNANKIDDYTFSKIAKHIYNNDEASELTFDDMVELLSTMDIIIPSGYLFKDADGLTDPLGINGIKNIVKLASELANGHEVFRKNFEKSQNLANTYTFVNKDGSRQLIETHGPSEYEKHLHHYFLRDFNGSIGSLYELNQLGKLIWIKNNPESLDATIDKEDKVALVDAATLATDISGEVIDDTSDTVVFTGIGWIDRVYEANRDYNADNVNEILSDLPISQKIDALVINDLTNFVNDLGGSDKLKNNQLRNEQERLLDKYDRYSDQEVNKAYLQLLKSNPEIAKALGINISSPIEQKGRIVHAPEPAGKHISKKSQYESLRYQLTALGSLIGTSKRDFDKLPEPIKQLLAKSKKTGRYDVTEEYKSLSTQEKEATIDAIKIERARIKSERAATKTLMKKLEATQKKLEQTNAKLKDAENAAKQATKNAENAVNNRKGLKVVDKRYTYQITEKVAVSAPGSATDVPEAVDKIMKTTWNKTKTSNVKKLSDNVEYNVKNGESFYAENSEALISMSTADAEQAALWFIGADMNVTDENAEVFKAIKFYFMGFIYREMQKGGQFSNMSDSTKQAVTNYMNREVHMAATFMGMWSGLRDKLNPIRAIFSARLEIAGVELTKAEQDALIEAAESNDIERINEIQARIIERIKSEKTSKNTIGKSILTVRNMSMLSSPLTWLRNKVSNIMLKALNKISSAIGNKIWTKKTKSDQLKMKSDVTTEITDFINANFVNNGLFDSIVENLSKYNPSDIHNRFKTASGAIDKNAIFANMVIKSMYNKFYNENMFSEKFNFLNKTHKFLMKQLSDNNYVREAALRYFGQIIAEKGYKLTEGVTDEIMTDFANAIGMGMSDYMHSDNFLNSFERIIAEKGEGWHFAYKLLLPFAATSWNWMKAAVRYSPIGLLKSIYQLATLDKTITKAEAKWGAGKSQVTPEMTEYLVRRNLGSGIIGTVSLLFGMMLASLGVMSLEEDDYGKPKIRVGNVAVDVSQIFGTSSLLAGAAFISTLKDGDGFVEAMDNTLDTILDGFFLLDIMNLDLYSGGGTFATGLDFLESTILSFIPNALAYVAGATYTGNLRKTNLFYKACAKVPFLANIVPKKANPYDGSTGGIWDIFNRIVPYVDIEVKSNVTKMSEAVGLSKDQLSGKYEINNKKFELSAKETAELNKQYGEWNAAALTNFYSNKTKYKVKVGNVYQTLSYDQMTDKQRKTVANNIMTTHANYAKILAWLNNGNKYYASDAEYNALRELGITGKLYKGNKGFV